jgi:uncharacterized protein
VTIVVDASVPECTACGTCCFSHTTDYLTVAGVDYERLGSDAPHFVQFQGQHAFMKMHEGHCAALVLEPLTGRYLCSIYERRPDVCRWLERGSGQCRAERHEKSEQALIALRRKSTVFDG